MTRSVDDEVLALRRLQEFALGALARGEGGLHELGRGRADHDLLARGVLATRIDILVVWTLRPSSSAGRLIDWVLLSERSKSVTSLTRMIGRLLRLAGPSRACP